MTNRNDWLLKNNLRSVDNLRLWSENPRLDPESSYSTTRDFVEEIVSKTPERNSFVDLIKSIATRGFIPADPIVVWQNPENNKYFVAEGNRRVLAIKMLRAPNKAPKSIRGIAIKLSSRIDRKDFDKIHVSIAPTFEDAEWYISQRHSTSSLQRKWSAEQQSRWIADLYEKYNGNIDIIKDKINLTEAELQRIIRILKIKSYTQKIRHKLSEDEYNLANSHHFPITNLERFFSFNNVKEAWGIQFIGYDVSIANEESFLNAFPELIKRMLLPQKDPNRIDSRIIRTAEDTKNILNSLPSVNASEATPGSDKQKKPDQQPQETENNKPEPNTIGLSDNKSEGLNKEEKETERRNNLKNNPDRPRLICEFYEIETDSHKLTSIFNELKNIPLKYKNAVAASIRIFLDLSVLNYIDTENLEKNICKEYGSSLREINLKKRLEFIKKEISDQKTKNTIGRLLNSSNEYSLDVLNGYVHNHDTHYLSLQFLNGFWDFLLPIFQKLIVIKEIK